MEKKSLPSQILLFPLCLIFEEKFNKIPEIPLLSRVPERGIRRIDVATRPIEIFTS